MEEVYPAFGMISIDDVEARDDPSVMIKSGRWMHRLCAGAVKIILHAN